MSQPQRCEQDAGAFRPASERPWVRAVARGLAALLLCQPAFAQVTPGKGAQAGQRPIMDAAQNGVPIAHIAPPSRGGVSRNQYDQFNVDGRGLILNNSASATQSLQGGWISGNLQLGPQAARIILNEVTGAGASQLRGAIEVAGSRANIVVANRNGISCDGCGFLNTNRATLVTGRPQIDGGGALAGFDVRQGQLAIGAGGLNAGKLEQLDLIARGMVIDGEIWATSLNVIGGANQVLYGTLQATAQAGTGSAPRFAIDIRNLGAMVANQVYLVSSERGVGVNSTGRLAALQGNLLLSANGDLTLNDSYARQAVRIDGAGSVSLAGHTQSDAGMAVTAAGTLSNTGAIDAAARLDLQGGTLANTGSIVQHDSAGMALDASGHLVNRGSIRSAGAMAINAAGIVDDQGLLQSSGELRLQAGFLTLTGTQLASDAGIAMTATGGPLAATGTRVRAASLDARASAALDGSGNDWQVTGNAAIRGASVANRNGTVLANGGLTVAAGGALDNNGGKLLAGAALAVTGQRLANAGGLVAGDGAVTVQASGGIDNRGGTLSAGASLAVASLDGAVDNSAGRMIAADGVELVSGSLVNNGGSIVARGEQGGALNVHAASLSNRQGLLDAATVLAVTSVGAVDNTAGTIRAATGAVHIASGSLDNTGGRVLARDALAIATGMLDNGNAGIVASSDKSVRIDAGRLGNTHGTVSGAGAVTVSSEAFDNTGGELSSGGDLRLDTHGQALTNRDGMLLAAASLTMRAGAIDSSAQAGAARIAAGGMLDIVAGSLANGHGLVSGGQGATLALGSGTLGNQGGTIESGGALAIAAGLFAGQGGSLNAADTVSLGAAAVDVGGGQVNAGKAIDITSAGMIDNRRGRIVSDGRTNLTAATLVNAGGLVSALQASELRFGAGALDNTAGSISGKTLAVEAGEIRNATGVISTAAALTLDTGTRLLDNSGGQIVSGGALTLRSGRFVNTGGTAASIDGGLTVATGGQALDNDGGKLQASGDVTLTTGALSNRNGLISGQRLLVDNSTFANDGGKVIASGALDMRSRAAAGVLSNDRGLLQAGGALAIDIGAQALVNTISGNAGGIVSGATLKVNAGSLDNRAGFIGSKDAQALTVAGDLDNRAIDGIGGQIAANAGSAIRAGSVFNQGGRIDALGNSVVTAGLLDNGGGAIAANGAVTLDASTLDNRARNGVAGTIDGASISATTTTTVNRGGIVRASGDTTLNAASLDNSGGSLGAAGMLRVSAASLANDNGRIVGDGGVVVTTGSQSPGGTIASQRDVILNIGGDYLNTGLLSAKKNLTVNAANIANDGTLTAGDTLTANTGNLVNSGEISAQNTRLDVAGTLTNTATGLINGVDTRIDAGTVDNAGRIYGDLLRINAGTLTNRGTGVLAARDTLLAGVKNLNNTGGGLIYSLGDLGIGGSIDPAGKLQGAAQSLLNASSRIEAAGRMAIFADSTVNRNDAISTRVVSEAPVNGEFVQPADSPSRYPVAQCFGIGGSQDGNSCIAHPDKFGQRSAIAPVYSQVILSRDVVSGDTTYIDVPNYSWDSPIFARYQVVFANGAPPAEPARGCTGTDLATGAPIPVDTPQCRQWAAARETWGIAFDKALAELDGKVNAYNTAVNEDNRVDSFEDYTWYKVASTTSRTEIVSSAPGQLLAGGMLLSGSMTNRDSQIVAGGALTVVGPDVKNIATQGETTTVQHGTSEFSELVTVGVIKKHHSRSAGDPVPYNPSPVVVMTDLPTMRFESLAGTQTSVRDFGVSTSSADTSAAGNAQAATRGRDGASAVGIDAFLSSGAAANTVRPTVPVVQRVAASGTGLRANDVILTTPPVLVMPGNALFVLHPEPAARYLVETDPRFTNYRSFISSDYFQQTLKRDPEQQLKRYGDGFLEQQLVNDQILALTGRRYIDGYASTEEEYKALMDAGVAYALQYQFSPGIALSAEQMALLSTDIVWLETRSVTLADGSTQQVIAPQVYLRRPIGSDLQPNGALMAGGDVLIRTERDLLNSGTVAGTAIALDAGGDLLNQGGRVDGQNIWMRASNDLKNLSGVITAAGPAASITLLAGRDIVLQTQAQGSVSSDGNSSRSSVQRVATVQGGDIRLDAGRDLRAEGATIAADGKLAATAARDIKIFTVAGQYQLDERDSSGRSVQGRSAFVSEAATINQGSALSAGGDLAMHAGRDVLLKGAMVDAGGNVLIEGRNVRIEAATDRVAVDVQAIGQKSYSRTARDNETLLGSSVTAANNVTVRASGIDGQGDGNITLAGSIVSAKTGAATLDASNDITIGNAVTSHRAIDQSYSKSGDLLTTTTTTKSNDLSVKQAEGSVVNGNAIVVTAGHDLAVRGSAIVGEGDVTLSAVNDVSIRAATSTSSRKASSKVVEQGFLDSDAVLSYGERTTTTGIDENGSTQSGQERSLVGSGKGNLSVTAGRALNVTGSDLAAGQDIVLQGRSIKVDPGRDRNASQVDTRVTEDALSVSVGGTVVNAMQAMQSLGEAAGKTKNPRMQAMAAATAALAAANLARDIAANGVTVSVSITGGHSESRKTETHSTDSGAGSTIAAGRNLTVIATGGGKDSNIDVIGSDLSANGKVVIRADNQVNLTSSQDLEEQHSSSKRMSAAAGVGVSVGTKDNAIGVAGSVSASQAHEDGSGVTQRNTHVTGGESVTIVSGGDANLKGSVIAGGKVTADIGGNLNIESRQDTAKFDSKSQSVNVSAIAGWGASVSASYSQSTIANDYASVQEQSGIRAGAGGFDVKVAGNTDLKGGVISSTQDAVNQDRNTFVTRTLTQSDVQNHADYRGESFGVSGGVSSGGGDGKDPNSTGQGKGPGGSNLVTVASTSSAGMGMPVAASTGSSKDSVTKSGISAGSIVITDDASQQAATGKSAAQTVASVNRDVATGRDTSGKIANDFDKATVQAELAIVSAFVKQASPLAASMVGDFSKSQQDRAQQEANGYLQQADAARRTGDTAGAAAYDDRARQAQGSADNWGDNGVYRLALHAGTQAALGGISSGAGAAASAAGGTVGGFVGQQLGKGLGEHEADRRGLTGTEKAAFVNSYQQGLAMVGGVVGGAAAGGGTLGAAVQGGGVATAVDVFNRQLHPDETKWIKDNASRYAQQKGISQAEAERRLGQQAYRQTQDGATGTWDPDASAFLKQAHGMLSPDTGCSSCGPGYMFQATAAQKADTGMYANLLPQTADFYARNGIRIPTAQQAAAATQRGSDIRDKATTGTLLAPVIAASATLAGLAPTVAAWALANPVAATKAGVITVDVAAQIASEAVTPGTVAESMAVKVGANGAASNAPRRLTYDALAETWTSPGGLVYGQGSAQGNRVLHVLEHTVPDPSKPVHSVFDLDRTQMIGLVDEAWAARAGSGTLQSNGNRVWVVDMGRQVGTDGQTPIQIVVRDGTTQVITAFPK